MPTAPKLCRALTLVGGCLALAAPVAHSSAQTPGYHLVGVAPGHDFSQASGVSADGRVVAGYSSRPGSHPGFVWSEGTGRYDFGLGAGIPSTTVTNAISGDGAAVAGMTYGPNHGQAFRWSAVGGFQALGSYYGGPDARAEATAISGDGSVVVGGAMPVWNGITGQAFRWTQATGMQGIGYPTPLDIASVATGISRDGTKIVGYGTNGGGYTTAFTWTLAGGMQVLPPLPLGPNSYAAANGTNFDGSFVVGQAAADSALYRGVLWHNGVPRELVTPSGWRDSYAFDVSDDGQIASGWLATSAVTVPAVWTADDGWLTLPDYFASQGMPVPAGWTLGGSVSMSANGRTFALAVHVSGGAAQGLVVTVPSAGTCSLVATVLALGSLRRRRAN